MSYAAVITTKREIVSNLDGQIIKMKDPIKQRYQFTTKDYSYFITVKKEFYPPYYPKERLQGMNDKNNFINILTNINKYALVTNLFFVDIGEDETVYKTIQFYWDSLMYLIQREEVQANVLYKIKHYYTEYK